jgi:hypothetical protein
VLSIVVTVVWAVLTVVMTFALPRLRRPGAVSVPVSTTGS